jgi:hypothetical protein
VTEPSSAAPDWRQAFRTHYASLQHLVGPAMTRIHLEAAITIAKADARIDPTSKAELIEEYSSILQALPRASHQ